MPLPQSVKLSSGYYMPTIGFGTWDAVQSQRGALREATAMAIKTGYRHIDTASVYGTEIPVGEAIRTSGVPRKDIFVTTKVWNHMHKNVEKSCDMSLKNMGLDYIDLLLIHWPIAFKAKEDGVTVDNHPDGKPILDEERSNDHSQTWKDMESLVSKGKVRSIGVSNFNAAQLQKLLKTAKIIPAVNQIEIHPWLVQFELHQFCKEHKIILTAYSPLGGQHPGGHRKHGAASPLHDETIESISKKLGKEPAQVILSWLVQRGNAVIPKSSKESRMKSNFELFELDKSDFDAIGKITENVGEKRYGNLDPIWGSSLFEGETL